MLIFQKKTLEEDIKSEISGKFLTGVLALLTVNTRQFYKFFIKNNFKLIYYLMNKILAFK